MKVLLLITIITWSFGSSYNLPTSSNIFNSPEEAAMWVYQDKNSGKQMVEPFHKEYHLYEIDLPTNLQTLTPLTMKEIPILDVTFVKPAETKFHCQKNETHYFLINIRSNSTFEACVPQGWKLTDMFNEEKNKELLVIPDKASCSNARCPDFIMLNGTEIYGAKLKDGHLVFE